MADPTTPDAGAAVTAATPAAGETAATTTTPPAGVIVRPSTKARAAEIMANFRKEQAAAAAKEAPAAGEPAKTTPVVPAPAKPEPEKPAPAADNADDDANDAQDELAAKAPATEETAGKPDADLQARLDRVAKAEKRNRDALARDVAAAKAELRATIDTERAKLAAEHKSSDDARREKFRRNPVAAVREWGLELSDDDLNYIGRQFYGETKAAAADPKNRDLVERARREREKDEANSATQKRLDKLETEQREKEQAAEARRQADAYLASVTKSIGPDHVVIKDMHAKNAGKATMRISEAAIALMQAGDEPTPAEVLAEAEKRERAELEDRGIDVAAHVARLAGKKPDEPAAKKPTSPTAAKPAIGSAVVTGLAGKTTREKLAELKKREDYPKT